MTQLTNLGASAASAATSAGTEAWSSTWGTRISSTRSVTTMAKTPSLSASTRPRPTSSFRSSARGAVPAMVIGTTPPSTPQRLDDQPGRRGARVLLLSGDEQAVADRELAELLVDDEVRALDPARLF